MPSFLKYSCCGIFMLLAACAPNESYPNETNQINWKNLSAIFLPAEFEIIDIVHLETTPDALMKSAKKVAAHNGKFYLLDPRQHAVFVFTETGKFVEKIGNAGDGPNTIDVIVDFAVNKSNGQVELLSPKGRMVTYNPENGEYKSMLDQRGELPALHSFSRLSEDVICFHSLFSTDQVLFYSLSEQSVVSQWVPAISSAPIFGPSITFVTEGDKLFYLDAIQSKLYRLQEEGASFFREFNLGGDHVRFSTEEFKQWQNSEQLMSHLEEKELDFPITNLYLDDEATSITFYHGGRKPKTVFKRSSGDWKLLEMPTESNSFLPFATKSSTGFVGLLRNPEELSTLFPEVKDPKPAEFAVDGENPVLLIYK